jgi:hypothetical protein
MAMFDDLIPQGGPNITVRPSRGERNNNFGNIEDGPFARSQPGYVGSDGRFARFETADHGLAAIDALLSSYGRRGFNTPDAIINRWAPPTDNNPTQAYSAYVAEGLGVAPNATLDMNDPSVRRKVAERIAQFETGKRQPVNATPIPDRTRALSFDDLIPQQQEQTEGRPNVTIRPTQQQTVSAGDALAGGVAQGVSLNFYDELRGLMEAGGLDPKDPASLTTLLQGAYKYWSGDPEATQRYDAATGRERQVSQQAQEQQPVASIAGNVLGAVALPIGGALQAATLPGRIGRGAAVGAGAGAAYGAGEGSGLEDRAARAVTGAAIGTVAGAAAPVALSGVEKAAQGVSRLAAPVVQAVRGVRDVDAEAARRIVAAQARDMRQGTAGMTPQEFASARAAGAPVAVADMGGETTRALARSSANTSSEGRAALESVTSERFASQSPRTVQFLKETFDYPDAGAKLEQLHAVSRLENRPAYLKAYNHPNAAAIWDDGLEQLASAPVVQDAIRMAGVTARNRNALDGFPPIRNPFSVDKQTGRVSLTTQKDGGIAYPNLQFWDHVKRNLDKINTSESRAASRALRDHLDDIVPEYKDARAGAAKWFGAEDALEAGAFFVTQTGEKLNQAKRALAKMSPADRKLFETGFISNLIAKVHELRDGQDIVKAIYGAPAARERIRVALGDKQADLLEAHLLTERVMDRLRPAVQGNSTTARQLAEIGLAGGLNTGVGAAAYGVATGDFGYSNIIAGALWAGAKGKIDQRIAKRVGEMLASNDPKILLKGLHIVARNRAMKNALLKFDPAAARVGGEQSTGMTVIPAVRTGTAEEDQPAAQGPRR